MEKLLKLDPGNTELLSQKQRILNQEIQATKEEQSAVALQKISAAGTKLQDVGGRVEGVGKSLLPVSAAIAGVGAAGIKVASDFEKAMSEVQVITGATGEDFGKLREKAIDLGASTSFSSKEGLGTVSTIVSDAITGFGLSAKDSARVADLMTQAANSGTIGISDLVESYKYVAPLAQSMGLFMEDVTTALSAMSMAGFH